MAFFKVTHQSKKSKARLGIIHTEHGDIQTPAFVPVATKGTIKTIPPRELKEIGVRVAFVNTFHLTVHPGVDVIKKVGGIHKYANLDIPLMSDSAGFQIFSLGGYKPNKKVNLHEGQEAIVQRINEEGVVFLSPRDGKEIIFTPELSIQNQEKIGADIIMAFDECIFYGATRKYTKEATERTHRWLLRCIESKRKEKSEKRQKLYGIIQGGVFKDLRIESAKFVTKQNVNGIAIGGVAIGESSKEIREQVRWVSPYLPDDQPVHLLGVGRVEDILELIPYGIDTFDCVEPTRLARNGIAYCLKRSFKHIERVEVTKRRYLAEKNPIQKTCTCYTCQNFSLAFLHHLFKERELLGYHLATYHNLYFFAELFENIRKEIREGNL